MGSKFRSALFEFSAPENLSLSLSLYFRDTPKSKRGSRGVDGVSLNDIGRKNPALIAQLSRELRNEGASYEHAPLRAFPLEKPGKNTYRVICIPTVKDRLLQRALLDFLARKSIHFETPISYGDHGKRSVKVAIDHAKKLRAQRPWVYKTDISNFFDNINRARMKEVVRSKLKLRSLHPIMFQAIDAEISKSVSPSVAQILKACGIRRGRGLRQGLPLSPMLSNLYLGEFDRQVESLGYKAIRYVDDLAFFCETKSECREIHDFCSSVLKSKFGLNIPALGPKKSKSQIYKPEEEAEFLGMLQVWDTDSQTYKLLISDSQISRTFEKFRQYADINANLSNGIKFSQLSSKLESVIQSYGGHYSEAENYSTFEKQLRVWKGRVYKKLVKDGLKVESLEEIDANAKVFFHLTDLEITK